MPAKVDGRKADKAERLVKAQKWADSWTCGTTGMLLSRGRVQVVRVKEGQGGWPVLIVQTVRDGKLEPGELAVFYGAREDLVHV